MAFSYVWDDTFMRLPNLREESRYIGLPAHVRHIAEIIAAFDPTVYIEILPSTHPQHNPQKPFSLTHRPVGAETYVIANYHERDIDARIVAEFIEGKNNLATGGSYDEYEALEKAWEISKAKRRQEEHAERVERMVDMLKIGNSRNYAVHNGRNIATGEAVAAPTKIYLGR